MCIRASERASDREFSRDGRWQARAEAPNGSMSTPARSSVCVRLVFDGRPYGIPISSHIVRLCNSKLDAAFVNSGRG